MQFFQVANFHTLEGGSVQLPRGNFVAAAIAASSEVDICSINGRRLGPMSIVPITDGCEVKAIRGYRTGSAALGAIAQTPVGTTLELQLYEACDIFVPPGPRAPLIASTRLTAIGATVGAATLALRLSVSGRSKACVRVSRDNASALDANVVIRGISYLTREQLAKDTGGTADQSMIDEVADTLGTSTSVLNAADRVGGTFYIGGDGDNREWFDELEVWVYGTTSAVNVSAETSGERS